MKAATKKLLVAVTAGAVLVTTAAASQAATKPAPFNAGTVKIALVQHSGAGDYFQQWTNGAKKQAAAIGIDMQIYDAQADNAKHATDLETAIGSGVKAIIVDHGNADTVCPGINKAIKAGIPVAVYDVDIRKCAPEAPFRRHCIFEPIEGPDRNADCGEHEAAPERIKIVTVDHLSA